MFMLSYAYGGPPKGRIFFAVRTWFIRFILIFDSKAEIIRVKSSNLWALMRIFSARLSKIRIVCAADTGWMILRARPEKGRRTKRAAGNTDPVGR
jgi:hypothetical protein